MTNAPGHCICPLFAIDTVPDGSILIATLDPRSGSAGSNVVVRKLKENGQLNGDFGVSGRLIMPAEFKSIAELVVEDSGSFFLTGNGNPLNAANDIYIARFSSDGVAASGFGI